HRQHAACQRSGRGRADHGHLVAPGRQPRRAQAQARTATADPRSLRARLGAARVISFQYPSENIMTINIRRFDSTDPDFKAQLAAVLAFEASEDEAIDRAALRILDDVKKSGDAAVLEYTKQFDQVEASNMAALEIGRADLQAALDSLSPARRAALQTAADRVRDYHERQKNEIGSNGFTYTEADGTVLGQKVTPLDRVGLYVPGGKAAYPSSVLMNAIPAKVAGVPEVIMVVPTPGGVKNELVLAAAAMSGVDRVFTIGGAQAVGALAYGTATIPQVDK